MSLFQRTNKQSRLTSPEAAGKEDCFKLYLWAESGGKGERNPGDSQMAARVLSPFSIWLMQSERILPELLKLQGLFLHQPWCPDSPVTQSIVPTPSRSLGGLFNGAYVWVNGQIRLLEETADPPLFPLTLPCSFLPFERSRDWRLEEAVK